MEHNRREHDNMTDHDLIIAHSVKIDTLCKLIRANTQQMAAFSDKLDERCVHIHDGITGTHKEIFAKIDGKTDNAVFRWLIGIIVIVILAMAGIVGSDKVAVNTNKGAITQLECAVDDLKEGVF